MKHLLSLLIMALICMSAHITHAAGVVQLPKTGQSICYNSSGSVITCAGTGQDGELQSGLAWPSSRFAGNGDQTVTDLLTGLVWSQNANPGGTTRTWQGALDYIKTLNDQNHLGYNDWRLPNRKELMSLVNWGQSAPYTWLNSQGFSAVQGSYYWSGSTHANSAYNAWIVSMYYGNVGNYNKTKGYYVWPVRSGQYWTLDSLTLTPGANALGSRPVGSTSGRQTVQIKNSGATAATLSSISFNGADAAHFNVTPGGSNPCASLTPTLAVGASCTVMVSAVPTASGAKSANLTFASTSGSQDIPFTMTAYSTVLGTISDQSTGLVVSGATVSLNNGASATSDATGAYNFGTTITPGTYSVSVTKAGYQTTSTTNLTVSSTQSGVANINLPTVGFLNLPTQTLPPADLNKTFSTSVLVSGGTVPYTFSIPNDPLPTGLTLDPATGIISGIATAAGTASFTVRVTDNTGTVAEASRSINVADQLAVTTASLPAGEVAQEYTNTFTSSGGSGTVTFAVSSGTRPAGLILSLAGILSGTPTTTGSYTFSITATDAVGRTATKQYTVAVAPAFVITTTRLNDAMIGTTYNQSLSGAGGQMPYNWEIVSGTLPTDLRFDAATGTISGTPSSAATPTITFGLRDSTNRLVTKALAVNVLAPLAITTTTITDAITGIAYSQPVQKNGGIAPYTYSYQGSLPVGLTLNTSTGVISGTSNDPGTVNFGITITDGTWPTPQSATKALSIKTALKTAVISKPGDCDDDGTVTIAEVQSAINMFLGLKTVAACVDTGGDSSVSIAEVQKAINSFLGL